MVRSSSREGFTLPEVLVAVFILTLLVAVLVPGVGRTLANREAADASRRVAALIRTASSVAASQEVYVEVVHSPANRRVFLRRAESASAPFVDMGPEYAVRLPPSLAVSPSGFTLRFGPGGLLESPAAPVTLAVGPRSLTVSRWGEVR